MADDTPTLRRVPDPFRSAMFIDHGRSTPETAPWEVDPRRIPDQPFDFVAVLGIGSSAANAVRYQRLQWVLGGPILADPSTSDRGRRATEDVSAVSHSAERVANAIVLATRSPTDVRTLNAWGQHVGVSRGALRVWCQAAGVSARSCLDFLRLLRAVLLAEDKPWDLPNILDVVDQRTLVQLLHRGSVRELFRRGRPAVQDFLSRQRYIRDERLVEAVSVQLVRAGTADLITKVATAMPQKGAGKRIRRK